MSTEVKLPSLGDNIESGDVLSVLVKEGDTVEREQGLLELETDKATIEVPSPMAGRIAKIHVKDGDTVAIGAVIFTMDGENGAAPAKAAPKAEKPAEKAPAKEPEAKSAPAPAKKPAPVAEVEEEEDEAPAPSPKKAASKPAAEAPAKSAPRSSGRPVSQEIAELPRTPEGDVPGDGVASAAAGPAVRRLARELGVDLRRVRATGEGGRLSKEDVQAFVREQTKKSKPSASASGAPGEPSLDDYGPVRREKMSRMRQTIAKNMLASYTTIPQLTNFDDADVTELEEIRQQNKSDYAKADIKLTTLPFLVKAVAAALRKHPLLNSSVDMETNQIIYKEYVNIGIAVDTERGLVVPVLRDVDQLTIPQITRALATIAEQAREGTFAIEDLRGGTFTISNLGAIGGTYSTPIINPPEVAILLAGRTRQMPVYLGDKLVPRLMMPLSITYDHRAVDGGAAARFLNDVKSLLSAPSRLLLAP